MVYFGEKSVKITVFLADFSPKMTKVRPKYVAWGCIQDRVVFTRIRYLHQKPKKLNCVVSFRHLSTLAVPGGASIVEISLIISVFWP